jgi:adenylate kinase
MTLFVGGIHAVGKTFVLKPVCEELGVRHATASQLIKEQLGLANWTVSRQVDDIEDNQRALVAAVRRLEEGGETVVLDGHFVLRRGVNVHEQIGVETFAQLMVRGVIVADRLRGRGDATWEQSEIAIFAQKELEHAQTVCLELDVPLVRLCSPSMTEVRNALVLLRA